MDNKNNNNIDEEYKFQDSTESTSNFSSIANNKDFASTFFEKTRRRHIFLLLLMLAVSLGIYKVVSQLMHRFSASKSVTAKIQKSTTVVKPTALQMNNAIMNRLNQIEHQQHEFQSQIQGVDSEFNNLKSTLADYHSRLLSLDEQTQQLQTQQDIFLQKQKNEEMKRIQEKKLAPKPIYYVRAIIPGRVWLSLQDGSTLTLGLGDKLTGYGVITAIYPEQRTISLSSGAVIGYNPDDR